MATKRKVKYIFRHRFRGTHDYNCPYCGHWNIVKDTTGRVFAFICQGVFINPHGNREACKARLVMYVMATSVPRGSFRPPPDKSVADGLQEAMPLGEFKHGVWRSGRACNILMVTEEELPEN